KLDPDRDTVTRVSYGEDDSRAVWTPDGRRLIWVSSRLGHYNLFWAAADGSAGEQELTRSRNEQTPSSVSPDGRYVAVTERTQGTFDIALVALTGDHKEQPYLATPFNERELMFSPDGKWVIYVSDESGRDEIYLRPFSGSGGKWRISVDGASACRWTRSGKEISYKSGSRLFVVPVNLQGPHIGKPQLLFDKPFVPGSHEVWDFSPDDREILWVKPEKPPIANELRIILNWMPPAG
ncbi:MAG TPA: hypothetical protein VKH35_03120, partial [Thermoanaerobaculia bacterium]|nr:hypothetical protein [Thermoanaerobaculia bacterium]